MATPTSLPATFVAGNVLTAAQMNDLRGAFRILQVVRATDTTQRTTTSSTYVDANISVTITPTSTSSNILLVWTSWGQHNNGTAQVIYRAITDASNVIIDGAEARDGINSGNDVYLYTTIIGFHSPATTSATTYKGRFHAHSSAGSTALLNNADVTGQLFALEISA